MTSAWSAEMMRTMSDLEGQLNTQKKSKIISTKSMAPSAGENLTANGVAIKNSKGAWSKRPALKDLRGDAKVKRVKGGEAWSVPFTTPAEVAETPERAPVADIAEVEAVVEVANEAAEEENLSLDVTQHKAKYLFPDC